MKSYLFILVSILLFASCQRSTEPTKLDKLAWLVGEWQMKMEETTFYESWEKTSDSTLEGKGLLVKTNGDTLFNEKLAINLRENTLYYEPTVSNQNEGKEVSFKEAELQDTLIRFENYQHDFPQIICYTITKDKKIHAYVSGVKDGKENRSDFFFEAIEK